MPFLCPGTMAPRKTGVKGRDRRGALRSGWPYLELLDPRTGLFPWGSQALSQSLCRPGIPLQTRDPSSRRPF